MRRFILGLMLLIVGSFPACARNAGLLDNYLIEFLYFDGLFEFYENLQKATEEDDSVALSKMLHFPFLVTSVEGYQLVIRTEEEFLKHYRKIFTPDVKKTVLKTKYAELEREVDYWGMVVGGSFTWHLQIMDEDMHDAYHKRKRKRTTNRVGLAQIRLRPAEQQIEEMGGNWRFFEGFLRRLKKAITEDDKVTLSEMMRYPLEIFNYNYKKLCINELKCEQTCLVINNKAQFIREYKKIITPEIKKHIMAFSLKEIAVLFSGIHSLKNVLFIAPEAFETKTFSRKKNIIQSLHYPFKLKINF